MYPEESDGTRILTMRFWPRGCKRDQFDVWMKHLAPSESLLRWIWDQDKAAYPLDPQAVSEIWRDRYLGEMQNQQEAIANLRERHEAGETITLLCACHDPSQCHRGVLFNLILNGHRIH